jgi:hypothetical protein
MAPEIKVLEKDERAMIDGCKADIYSLGISIIKLIVPEEKIVRNILKFYDKHVNDEKQEFYKLF